VSRYDMVDAARFLPDEEGALARQRAAAILTDGKVYRALPNHRIVAFHNLWIGASETEFEQRFAIVRERRQAAS
jgi:hypothetical protein